MRKLRNGQHRSYRTKSTVGVLVGLGCTGVETKGSSISVHGITILCTEALRTRTSQDVEALDLCSAVNAFRGKEPLMIASTRKRRYTVEFEDIPVVVRVEDLARLIAHSQELAVMKQRLRDAAINIR